MPKYIKITNKMVRKWCRKAYGTNWWECNEDVKEFRKKNARAQIAKKRACSNRSQESSNVN
jgi:hypothetical protein